MLVTLKLFLYKILYKKIFSENSFEINKSDKFVKIFLKRQSQKSKHQKHSYQNHIHYQKK